jgi:hypothetical protein
MNPPHYPKKSRLYTGETPNLDQWLWDQETQSGEFVTAQPSSIEESNAKTQHLKS